MTEIDRAFRDAEQMPVEDLWPDIVTRTPGKLPSRSPGPRARAAVVAIVVAVLGIGLLLRAFSEDLTQPATQTTNPPASHAPRAPDFSRVYEHQGYSPKLSPDGTTIAFLRDPEDQHRRDMGMNPYVLQVWLMDADGSGLRKLAQLPGCCIVILGDLQWSRDGSSIVLIADGRRRFDVATGRQLPMRSPTG
jgi:hypothetical protein